MKKVSAHESTKDDVGIDSHRNPVAANMTKRANPSKKVWVVVLGTLLLVSVSVVLFEKNLTSTNDAQVAGVNLKNIATYLSKSSNDTNKKAQKTFKAGDPIQVGYSYTSDQSEAFVRYVVKNNENGEEKFRTNLFKLNPNESELFVSINNTSLAAGNYTVELLDKNDHNIASVKYSITE